MTAHETAGETRPPSDTQVRVIARIAGNVQGVGFRPYLYQLAVRHGLRGRVANSPAGVDLEAEGTRQAVETFLADIPRHKPPLARITESTHRFVEPVGHAAFVIAASRADGHQTAMISPDVSVCDGCLREMFDPGDRRFRYPFINCTNCGPRYTIIAGVPYDRPATTMACFSMCATCRAEYDDPANRRFHAQPNACPDCGPRAWLLPGEGDAFRQPRSAAPTAAVWPDPIDQAAGLLQDGAILAVKGLGGFHLVCDATCAAAVERLRERKDREEKPLALMVPDLETAARLCHMDAEGETLLTSRERPITLLLRRQGAFVADAVAPGNPYLGLMLPYTPLHYRLLFQSANRPRFLALVMTSGNRKDEPIAIGNREAVRRLQTLADAFLLHNRDILIRADDSVVRRDGDRTVFLRRSRGYVPAPVFLARQNGSREVLAVAPAGTDLQRGLGCVLAVGAHLKNTIAIARGQTVFLSQHIGDLEGLEALEFLEQSVNHLRQILCVEPAVVAHDMHPDYLSTRFAHRLRQESGDIQLVAVQHHHAHVASCMAEHGLDGPVIGVALDGTGFGADGTVWGGEILVADYRGFRRAAHLREVPLPGGERAVREPWRMALSYLDMAYGSDLWDLPIPCIRKMDRSAAEVVLRASRRRLNSPMTTSCGRLFDAVAALTDVRQTVTYEGQAAIELEMALGHGPASVSAEEDVYPFPVGTPTGSRALVLDPMPLVQAVVEDLVAEVPVRVVSRRFHAALVQALVCAIDRVVSETGLREVVLSGGCFFNRFLTDGLVTALAGNGLLVFTHQLVPPGDGGLALGQAVVAARGKPPCRE